MITMRGVVIDIGGVLVHDRLLDTVSRWAGELALSPAEMLTAVYGGNDDTVLIGRVSEDEWWEVVRSRLGTDISGVRAELESGQTWHEELVAVLREVKSAARTAILSNAWPSQRSRMAELGLTDVVHELLLSCEIGCAKPDPNAFKITLQRLGTAPEETLFIDDTAGHVEAAASLGIRGHVHTTTEDTVSVLRRFIARGS
jgi:putative hydrolase of the HAD superfamily